LLQIVNEQGYLILATNHNNVDYIACAQRLAASLKSWHPDALVCLVTNQEVQDSLFDYVKQLPYTLENPYANDAQLFRLTPFRETIKLEADMLIVSPIDHWWNLFRLRDLVISTGCKNWRGETSLNRSYRKLFDENQLPDVYNAITYWRLSQTAKDFFTTVRQIFEHWEQYRKLLKFPEEHPSTDVVYAMAAQIIGPDLCTLPMATYPQIVHMKQHHAQTQSADWTQQLVWEYNDNCLKINTVAQSGAFHYHIKEWQP